MSSSKQMPETPKEEVTLAALREVETSSDSQPVKSYQVLILMIIAVLAGVTLASVKGLFNYNIKSDPAYVRALAPGAGDQGPQTTLALAGYMKHGAKIYSAKCGGCHQANGLGDGANYPPLVKSQWVTGEPRLTAMIILNGVKGAIEVDGKVWNGQMPAQGAGLSAKDLAGLMTYLRNSFGNETGDVISIAMAEDAMKVSESRANVGQQVTQEELLAEHNKPLQGDTLAVDLEVEKKSLLPL